MTKRIILAIVLSAIVAGSAFAQLKIGAGAGGYLTGDFGGDVEASVNGWSRC
jgi:hypothetical protein